VISHQTTRSVNGRTRSRAVAAIALMVVVQSLGCPDGTTDEPDAGVEPGWILETPVADIETLMDVVVLSPIRAYAVGSAGTVLRFDTDTWTREDSGTESLLRSVSGVRNEESGDETVIAVGDDGVVLLRTDDTWSALPSGTTLALFDVWVRAANDGFIVGESGTILRFTGVEVVPMADESLQSRLVTGPLCQNVSECDAGQVCAAPVADPTGATLCQDPNHPEGLIVERYGIPVALKSVSGTGGDDVLAAGPTGALYFYDGVSWLPEDSGTSRSMTHLYRGAGTWATANDGVILRRNGPSDWDTQSYRTPVPVFLQGLWATGGNDVFAVGLAGSIYHFEEGEWTTTRFDDDFHFRAVDGFVVAPATETTPIVRLVFAVGAGGRIARGPDALPR
jgi:photosystem II stability/assembly factor-like uncharacterized protein